MRRPFNDVTLCVTWSPPGAARSAAGGFHPKGRRGGFVRIGLFVIPSEQADSGQIDHAFHWAMPPQAPLTATQTQHFDISPNDQLPALRRAQRRLILVTNFFEELRQVVPER